MSSTTLYSISPDGSLACEAEYKNSHGFAPAIWTVLTAKYVPMGMPLGGTDEQRMHLIFSGHKSWMTSDDCFAHMSAASRDGRMSDSDTLCYAATLDFAAVPREHLELFADAFDAFVADHGPALGDHVLHLAPMAAQLRRLSGESVRGVCWNTSLADTFDEGVVSGDDEWRAYNFDRDSRHVWVGPERLRSQPSPSTSTPA